LMLKLLSTGAFCVAEKENDSPCKFCDYPAVCRHPQALEDLQKKKDDPTNTILDPWKELQNYE
jgi:ATP-dependent helicase/DNAse subunit B